MRDNPALAFALQLQHIYIRVIIAILAQHTVYLNFLYQVLIIGVNRRQAIE